MLYGAPKTGKSTFASHIPNALFLPTEEGLNELEVFQYKIKSWRDVLKLRKELQEKDHGFECLVVDIVDWFYKHCEHYVCGKHGVTHPSDLEYGKGFSLVKDEFIRVVNGLNQLGLGMVFICHAKEKEVKKKNTTYTSMDTSLGATTNNLICGMCDFIFFAYIDEDGKRVMRTKPSKYVNSGDRTGKLPEIMPFDYENLVKELEGQND